MDELGWRRMSVEEYLRTEEDSPVKREYVGGFAYPMDQDDAPALRAEAGASHAHVTITGNIFAALHGPARACGCRASASDLRLGIEGRLLFFYPDVMVACGPRPGSDVETRPSLLVEVLSRGTARTDRHAKYEAYTSLPTLQTYLIVDQYTRHVYAYTRQGDRWVLTEHDGQGSIELPFLDVTLSLDDIYDGVLEG